MAQNAANALALENNPNLNTENIKDLYQFFEDVYKSASSVDVSESLEAATTAQPLYPIGFMPDANLTIDFDNPAFHGMMHPPTASVASAAQAMVPSTAGFDITVQPFDEASYLPTYPNPALGSMVTPGMVPATVGMAPGMAPLLASQVGAAPNMVGGVMPPHAIPGSMGMMPGNPAFSMYGAGGQPMATAMVTPKGFIHQAAPVARVISQPQPVNYQLYTMQPQMKAREESLDPEVVESVFHEVIDDSKVAQAPASTDHQVPVVSSQSEKVVDAVRAQSEPAPESAHRHMSLLALDSVPSLSPSALSASSSLSPSPQMSPASSPRPPKSPVSLPAQSSRLPTQRRVESATVFSPTASPAVDPVLSASPTTTRSFMYPSRPYNQRICMTEGGDDEEYVDIAVHTNQSRTRTRPLTAGRPPAMDSSLKTICERHADFAATMLARLYELLAHRPPRANQAKDTASPGDHHHSETDDEYIKLEKEECPDESPKSPESVKDDLLAKFQQLSVGLVPSPRAAPRPFDITQSPEDANEMATYDEQIAKGYPAIPRLPSVFQ
ncbi:hypothetical protein H4R34_000699 [Dimargaris verticillata]|uniref:Uncharacterized protein n=1 Tax=Dimargaris verticillata TaxID=2761393 RepID=A0A9W8EFP3_9FUNG|nr:hypothetical protein H4R34_000699 [Dimargaris verticillata]